MAKKPRIHRIISTLPMVEGDDRLLLDEVLYEDALGRPFQCHIKAISKDHSIEEDDLLGTSLTVQYEPKEGVQRFINGLVSEVSYLGIQEGYSQYEIEIRPWIWFLKHHSDCRIFQEKTVVEILDLAFRETHEFTDYTKSLTGTFNKRTYCVQFRESDFDFVSRLLEEEGIYYYFEHEEKKHTLVLVDDAASHKPISRSPEVPFRLPGDAPVDLKHIWRWTVNSRLQTNEVTLTDYDFESPKTDLEVNSKIRRKHKLAKFSKYDYPGRYTETGNGNQLVKRMVESEQADSHQFHGATDELSVATGHYFKMADHPRKDQNNVDYLVTQASLRIASAEIEMFSARENELDVQFQAIRKDSPFRPRRITPRPSVGGPQSAVVVGKAGEEIWTDKHGRVKVQFPWDREGKNDENSSCWIRVSQMWAGKGWGAMHLPRIGQEVLVEFLDGDPDRPVITGRVYNGDQTTPYPLPANQTQSGIKSRSSKQGKTDHANELRFEDKVNEEEIYFHAERDFNQVVENSATLKVGFDKKDSGDQTIEVYNNRTLSLAEGSESIEIKKGNRELNVAEGKETITINGDQSLTVKKGNRIVEAKTGKQTIKAAQSIELIVGASKIKIEPAKITIEAPQVMISGQAKSEISAPITNISGDGLLALKGGIAKIN